MILRDILANTRFLREIHLVKLRIKKYNSTEFFIQNRFSINCLFYLTIKETTNGQFITIELEYIYQRQCKTACLKC